MMEGSFVKCWEWRSGGIVGWFYSKFIPLHKRRDLTISKARYSRFLVSLHKPIDILNFLEFRRTVVMFEW